MSRRALTSAQMYALQNRPTIGQSFKPRPPFQTGFPPQGTVLRWEGSWGQYTIVCEPIRSQDGRDGFDYGTFTQPGEAGGGLLVTPGAPRGILRWGSGGVARVVQFDWPVYGGLFNISGEQFELTVQCISTGTLAVAQDPRQLPEYRASLARGHSSQARAMTLAQRFVQGFGQASVFTLVPPFASWLSCSLNTVLPSQAPRIFQLQDSNTGAVCYDLRELIGVNTAGVPAYQRIPIITNAQRVQFQGPNAAGSTDIFAMWELGLE